MKQSTSKSNVITQVLLSVVAGVIGYLLLFNPDGQLVTLCQLLCGGLVAVGVISIVSFFLSEDYKRIDRNGFAYGVLLILLGCIGFLRMASLTANFEVYAGLLSLLLGVLTLQGTVQVKVLNYPVWILNLILALVSLAGSFFILAGITKVTQLVNGFYSWVLLICGISCLVSLLITWICILLAARREKKAEKEAAKQPESTSVPVQETPAPQPQAPAQTAAPEPFYRPEPTPAEAPAAPPVTPEYTPAAEEPAAGFTNMEELPEAKPELVFDSSDTTHME